MGSCTNDFSPNYIIWQQKSHGYGMHNLREWSPWSLTFIYPSIHPSIRLEQVTFGPNSKVSIPTVEEGNVSPRATKRGLRPGAGVQGASAGGQRVRGKNDGRGCKLPMKMTRWAQEWAMLGDDQG